MHALVNGGFLLCACLASAAIAACSSTPEEAPTSESLTATDSGTPPDAPVVVDAAIVQEADAAVIETPVIDSHVDYLRTLPKRDAQLQILCKREGKDLVSKRFCTATPPALKGLSDVQTLLGLSFKDPSAKGGNNAGGNPGFALLGHSSSLVARFVSSINPRAIVFTQAATPGKDYMIMGYTRGEQFVEFAVREPDEDQPAFYLLEFKQACNQKPGGCTTGDLYGPSVEKDWTEWTLYEEDDLLDTPLDCQHCHKPAGADKRSILRMQEHLAPWTHFFRSSTPGGQALLADFHAAHGHDENFGPIPAALVDKSDPRELQLLVDSRGFSKQPNEFPTATIEKEVQAVNPVQPAVNVPVGKSATWEKLYADSAAGKFIPVPYHDVKVTDPVKLVDATKSYRDFVAGKSTSMFDFGDVFLDEALAAMTFRVKPGATGDAIVVQACAQCHNPRIDPESKKARFDATQLGKMSRAEKDAAIARMKLPKESPLRMPPVLFRSLDDAEIAKAEEALRK